MSLGRSQGFSLFRHPLKSGVSVWYARFWDQTTQRYAKTLSTGVMVSGKKEHHAEATAAAYALLSNINFSSSNLDMLFIDYVENFWTSNSSYVKVRIPINSAG